MLSALRLAGKRLFYPGFDLHTRSRLRWLPKFFISGPVKTLDAGCGNGALSYAAAKLGNHVTSISFCATDIERIKKYFSAFESSLNIHFETMNLYDLNKLDDGIFDQIICSETLEHIMNDRLIIKYFKRLLKPRGILHLCCPYALHPVCNIERFIPHQENGGHVRNGYTIESYKTLIEPEGFQIIEQFGVGSLSLVKCDALLRKLRHKFGDIASLPLFLFILPFLKFIDTGNPPIPFSLYIKAIKT